MAGLHTLLAIATTSLATALASNDCAAAPANSDWHELASLPDPIGFAGMFAGVLGGRIVAGGGSQFNRPPWLGGEKVFNDRLYTLATPDAKWVVHATRLPRAAGYFARAATANALYLVGGIGADGCIAESWRISTHGDDFRFTRLPDLPHPLGYAAGAAVAGRIYAAGGLAALTSKSPATELWSLGIESDAGAGWRREPDLPGPGTFVAAAASDERHLYLFGGMTYAADGKPQPSARVYRFNIATRTWHRLADMPEPRVSAVSPCPVVPDGRILVIGGYATVFPGPQRDYPGFSARTLGYDAATDRWTDGPRLPVTPVRDRDVASDRGPAPMIAAPAVVWQKRIVVISGEVRAAVRSPAVLAWPLAPTP